MQDGQVKQSGNYEDLLTAGTTFEQLVNAHKEVITGLEPSPSENKAELQRIVNIHQSMEDVNKSEGKLINGLPGVQLTEEEEKRVDTVEWKPFLDYIVISEGLWFSIQKCCQFINGITTYEIDREVHQMIIDNGAYPSPLDLGVESIMIGMSHRGRLTVLVIHHALKQQHRAAVCSSPASSCSSNKRYDLMDANKKVDLEHVQCPQESKILTNIIKNHPLRFSIAASSSVPWIYMAQFWHTLKEDGSKYRLKFMLDKKELSLTLDDFRTIFHLPHANDNNHNSFMPPPSFSDMVPFYKQQLGFTMELKTSSSFKTTGLLQPWQTLCKIFSKCLTTRVTGWDQSPLQIMQMICARDMYHNLQDDDIMKNIFNSGRHKDKVGMQIPDWMITKEMKHTEHYMMYAEVFGLDVPLTQSQPTDSTQGIHMTLSAPRSPAPKKDTTESSAPKRSTVIRFCLPERRSTRLTPLAPVPTIDKADEMILQDTLHHLASEEIEKIVEGSEIVINEPQIPGTRLEPRSDKESPKVESTNDEEVEITNVVIHVNVNEEEDEITDEVYELKRREKGKIVKEFRNTQFPTLIKSPRTHTNLVSSNTEKLQELTVTDTQTTSSSRSHNTKLSKTNQLLSLFKAKPARFKRYKNFFQELQGRYTYLFRHLKERFLSRKSFDTLVDHLQEVMVESLPTMVDTHIKEQRGNIQAEISSQIQKAIDHHIPSQVDALVRSYMYTIHVEPVNRSQEIRTTSDDAPPGGERENSAKRQQDICGNRKRQVDDYDFWTDSYASDDDEISTKAASVTRYYGRSITDY
ncbi:hypothetical protein Tco_1368344 [Tanacetum coccineum]